MSEYIKVKTTKDDGKVCLWEQSDQHPDNEIFIKNDGQTYTVGLTSEVARRIKDGDLVEVGSKSVATDDNPPAGNTPKTDGNAPFEGYDEMNAGSIMERFATMTDEEKASLKAYEAAHKNRKGIMEA